MSGQKKNSRNEEMLTDGNKQERIGYYCSICLMGRCKNRVGWCVEQDPAQDHRINKKESKGKAYPSKLTIIVTGRMA